MLAHDWGSVGDVGVPGSRPTPPSRVASFTSIVRPERRPPQPLRPSTAWRGRTAPCGSPAALANLLRLTLHGRASRYRAGARRDAAGVLRRSLLERMLRSRDGIPANQIHHSDDLVTDAVNSMKVYRANYFESPRQRAVRSPRRRARPADRRHRRTRSCGTTSTTTSPTWASRLWRRDVKAGHWVADVASAGGRRSRSPSSSTTLAARTARPRAAARPGRQRRANRSATPWCRSPARQRHRPRDRAGVRPIRAPRSSSATSTRPASRRPPR